MSTRKLNSSYDVRGTLAADDRARVTVRQIFDALADRGQTADEISEFIAGMTDRFALEYAAKLAD